VINNQAVSDPAFYMLVVVYAVIIVGSVLGNMLVIVAVLRSSHMRKVGWDSVWASGGQCCQTV
jgi:hypothetical protein